MTVVEKNVTKIPLDKIVIPERRARSTFTEEQLELLKASMQKFGLVSYPIVRPLEDGRFELIDGEHRIQAAREAGLTEVECLVLPADAKDAAMLNILMNLARGEQDPIGIAIAIDNALKAGASYEEIAKAFNRSEQWVKFYHSLLELPEEYQQALKEKKLTVSHIREALRLPTLEEIDAALQTAMRLNWPVSVLKHYVDNRLEELKRHQAAVEAGLVEGPPPPPEPERLVKYSQCLICGRMVERERVYLPACCDECYQLAQYAVHLFGTGRDAMTKMYNAAMCYQSFQQQMQQLAMQAAVQQVFSQQSQIQPSQQFQNTSQQPETQHHHPTPPQQYSYTFSVTTPPPAPQPQILQNKQKTTIETEKES